MKLKTRLKLFLPLIVLFSCDQDVASTASGEGPILQDTLNKDLPGDSGNIDDYFYDLNEEGLNINDDYEYYDNLAISLQQGQVPLSFSTFSCFLTKINNDSLTEDQNLIKPRIMTDSTFEKHIVQRVVVSTDAYQNIPNMEWSEDNGRYIPQTQTVNAQNQPFDFIEDFGADGCPDQYEDGNGGCSATVNEDFTSGGESFIDVENGQYDLGEFFEDFGTDGCQDVDEDGAGGCTGSNGLSEDCADDPNGDNYDSNLNPSGTEGNGAWEDGEYFQDKENGVYDCTICDLTSLDYEGEEFTDENLNGYWDSGDPNNDNNDGGGDNDGILDSDSGPYIDCESYQSESECLAAGGGQSGERYGYCEWTIFLERADCSGLGEDCDPYVRQNPGVYDDGEDFIDINNNEERDSYCLDISSNTWSPNYLSEDDCNCSLEEGDCGRQWTSEDFIDNGVYSEGCRHYSDRAEYKVYRVTYDKDMMGDIEGQYYIDRDEWVRRDSIYSKSKIEYEHTFTQTRIGPSDQELMSRVNADCNENNARDDAEKYVQNEAECSDFERFVYKPENFTDDGLDQCPDINEDGLGGCLDYENHGVDGEEFTDALNGVYDEGEEFIDALNGVYDCTVCDLTSLDYDGEDFIDIDEDGLYDIGCPDQFEDGEGGCLGTPLPNYIEGDDPNGDNDHNNDNYNCGTDGLCPCDPGYDSPDEDGTEGGVGTQCNGVYDCVACDQSSSDYQGEDFENEASGTPYKYDTGFCDRSNQIWDHTEAHLDLELTEGAGTGNKGPTEPFDDRNCNGEYTQAESKNISQEECDALNGTLILAGEGLNSENFDFCDVGNGQFDDTEICMNGQATCDATQLYTESEKQYGSLVVSYGGHVCENSNGVEKWYSTQQDCQSDASCEDGSICDPNGAACIDGSACTPFCVNICSLKEPYALKSLSNQRDIFDRWGNGYYDIIEQTEEYKVERKSVDLIDSIIVVYSNPIIERLDSENSYDYTIAKSKWDDGGEVDYDYHIFRKSDEGYIMKLVHPSYFLPSESFAGSNDVASGSAFWFEEDAEEEVFLYTVGGLLRDGERYETTRTDTTQIGDYFIRESYAVDAEQYTAPLRKLIGAEVTSADGQCGIVCGYDENESDDDLNLNGVYDEGEYFIDEDGNDTYDEGEEFTDSGDFCASCVTIDDCSLDSTFNTFKVSKEKTTTLIGTGVEYSELSTSYFAKDIGLIRDDSEFKWNTPPNGFSDIEGIFRWVMVAKNEPQPSDCDNEGSGSLLGLFGDDKKVVGLDEFDQIDDSFHPYKKTRTYGLQRIIQERSGQ